MAENLDINNRSVMQNAVRSLNLIAQTLGQVFPQSIGTSSSATAGAATLPANPVGFLSVVNPATGETVKVPYYAE